MPYLACQTCGVIRHTNPLSTLCVKCITEKRRADYYECAKNKLKDLNYTLHTLGPEVTCNSVKVDITNHECGHRYKVRLLNVLNQRSKCAVCGPKKRMANALSYWMAKHGRHTYDAAIFDDYLWAVRKLSDKCYAANIKTLNPHGHPRSRPDLNPDAYQLDHIISVIECFKRGWTVEAAADITNLQMLPALENLSKQQYLR